MSNTATDDPWLYRYEARGIQRFVTGTQRLEEIAGASALVENLRDEVLKHAETSTSDVQILAVAAGSATIRFHSFSALERFAELWPLRCDRLAPGLRMVQGWIREHEHAPRDRMNALTGALAVAAERVYPTLPEAGPLILRSGRTGRPAIRLGEHRPGKRDLLDESSVAKLTARTSSHRLGRRFLGDAVVTAAKREPQEQESSRPGDCFLGEGNELLVKQADFGDHYVAVVHIDGNDIGARIRPMDVETYTKFAGALQRATEKAAQAGMAEILKREGARRTQAWQTYQEGRDGAPIPARPIVLGGDDCTILTLAEDAIPFTRAFLRSIADSARGNGILDGLTATAGIAFVKPNAPFAEGHRLAQSLCDWAKERLRGQGPDGRTPSSLAVHRVTTSAFAHWKDIRRDELTGWLGQTECEGGLTGGPWRLEGSHTIDQLERLAGALRKLPRGPIREWLRVVRHDGERARLRWDRIVEVAGGRGAWAEVAAALEALGADPATGWMRDGKTTPLHDAQSWMMVTGGGGA